MKRLVYSPSINVWIKTDSGVFDLSPYITDFQVDRRINQLSAARVSFRNPRVTDERNPLKTRMMFTEHYSNGRIGPMFHPMDPIIITLTRLKGRPIQVFTGYCDTTPYIQLLPGTATITASCTLKRLKYTFWDPALPFVRHFLEANGWGISPDGTLFNPDLKTTGNLNDGAIGGLLFKILTEVGGWKENNIFIQELPGNKISSIVRRLYEDTSKESASSSKELSEFISSIIGASAYGSAGGGGSGGSGGGGEGEGNGDPEAAKTYAKTRKGTVAFAIADSSGNITAKYNENKQFYGASITKAMVLVAYLRKYKNNLNGNQKNLLTAMIKQSDNDAANTLFSNVGADAVKKVASDVGMSNYKLNIKSDNYHLGGSLITAADQAKLFAKILDLIPSNHRSYAQGLMGDIQNGKFGVLSASSSAYGKTGWNPAEGVAHSGGNSGSRGIAVLVGDNVGNDAYNRETNTEVAKKLMTGGSGSGGGFTDGETFESTAYGPPWNRLNGSGVTSTGIKLADGPTGSMTGPYVVAVNPDVIPYHTKLKIWPNPFNYRGEFIAEDTGGAFQNDNEKRLDFYDPISREHQLSWGRRNVQVKRVQS